MTRKLADGSLYSSDDQVEMYRAQMGDAATERQVLLARKARGQCICTTRKVKVETGYETHKTQRTVHAKGCPRWKPWMQAYT